MVAPLPLVVECGNLQPQSFVVFLLYFQCVKRSVMSIVTISPLIQRIISTAIVITPNINSVHFPSVPGQGFLQACRSECVLNRIRRLQRTSRLP